MAVAVAPARVPRIGGRRRRFVALAGMVLVAVVLVGCTTVRTTVDLIQALQSAGFKAPSARVDRVNGFTTVVVRASSGPAEDPDGKAAEIVWKTFKVRFDQVSVNVGGQRAAFTRSDLEARFGPRPPGYDNDFTRDILRGVAVVGAAGVVVVLIVVLIVIVIVKRSRAKHPPAPPPGWYGPGPQWPPPSP